MNYCLWVSVEWVSPFGTCRGSHLSLACHTHTRQVLGFRLSLCLLHHLHTHHAAKHSPAQHSRKCYGQFAHRAMTATLLHGEPEKHRQTLLLCVPLRGKLAHLNLGCLCFVCRCHPQPLCCVDVVHGSLDLEQQQGGTAEACTHAYTDRLAWVGGSS